MRKITLLLFASLFLCCSESKLFAQEPQNQTFDDAIEDNSYFIEEAYNQEDRVVQHIFNAYRNTKPEKDFMLSFTQEWPAFGLKHQLSYTAPFGFYNSNYVNGLGDIMLNYRYQLTYKDAWAAISPRFSVILPTGDDKKGMGGGILGYQINLPVSKRLSNDFVAHFNAEATFLPNSKGNDGTKDVKKNLTNYNVGLSLIWLTAERLNFMFEVLENMNSEINTLGNIEHANETIISPGFRFSIPVGNVELVPGAAIPISINKNESKTNLFLYFSIEHPF